MDIAAVAKDTDPGQTLYKIFIDTCNIAYMNIIFMTSNEATYYEWGLEVVQGRCCRMTSKHMLSVLQRMDTESEAEKKIYGQLMAEYLECFDIDTPETQTFLIKQMYVIPGKMKISTLVHLISRMLVMQTPYWHLVVAVCENLDSYSYHGRDKYDNVLATLFSRLLATEPHHYTDIEMVAYVNSCYYILQTFRPANYPNYLLLSPDEKAILATRVKDFWDGLDRKTKQTFTCYEGDRLMASLP